MAAVFFLLKKSFKNDNIVWTSPIIYIEELFEEESAGIKVSVSNGDPDSVTLLSALNDVVVVVVIIKIININIHISIIISRSSIIMTYDI